MTVYVRGNPSQHDIDRFVEHVKAGATLAPATQDQLRAGLLTMNIGSLRRWADRAATAFTNRFGERLDELVDPALPDDQLIALLADWAGEHARNAVRAAVYERFGWEAPDEDRPARSSPGYEVGEGSTDGEPEDVTGR